MHASLRAFLDQIIDYAGLFPPAKLPLSEALANFLHEKAASPHRWMLGRFVCPAARLSELLPLARAHEQGAQLQVSVLGQPGATVEEFFLHLETAIKSILDFRLAWGTEQVIDAIEIALPGQAEIDRAIYYLGYTEAHVGKANLRGYLELPMSATWNGDVVKALERLNDLGDTYDKSPLGLKLRCGGVTSAAFPSDAEVAFFIAQCRDAAVPWKATAGLHHPHRRHDPALNVWQHGFLNVFGAGLLAQAHPLTQADLVAILSDRTGEHFRFDDAQFSWKDWSCTAAQVAEFRPGGPTSFGSCSFAEPCADLMAAGLLQ